MLAGTSKVSESIRWLYDTENIMGRARRRAAQTENPVCGNDETTCGNSYRTNGASRPSPTNTRLAGDTLGTPPTWVTHWVSVKVNVSYIGTTEKHSQHAK